MAKFEEYPKMLYRKAKEGHEVHGVVCTLIEVESAEEETDARAEGYQATPADAAEAAKKDQLAAARAAKAAKPKTAKKTAKADAEA